MKHDRKWALKERITSLVRRAANDAERAASRTRSEFVTKTGSCHSSRQIICTNQEIGKVYRYALEAMVRILHHSGGSFAANVPMFDREAAGLANVLASRQQIRIDWTARNASEFKYHLARLLRDIKRDVRNEYQLGLVGTMPLNELSSAFVDAVATSSAPDLPDARASGDSRCSAEEDIHRAIKLHFQR